MSDTPERIWHQHDGKGHLADLAELAVKPVDEVQAAFTEYLRAATAAAQVAAAYERIAEHAYGYASDHAKKRKFCASVKQNAYLRGVVETARLIADEARTLATDTQADALEQVRREAERSGYERGVRKVVLHAASATGDVDLMNSILALLDNPTPDEQTEAAQGLAFRKAVSS